MALWRPPHVTTSGRVHGRQTEGGPLVLERSVLLDEPLLVRAQWLDEPAAQPFAWDLQGLQSGDELGEEKQRRPCTKHAGWCWRARGVASERGFSCNKIKTTINHDGPDFEQQA